MKYNVLEMKIYLIYSFVSFVLVVDDAIHEQFLILMTSRQKSSFKNYQDPT